MVVVKIYFIFKIFKKYIFIPLVPKIVSFNNNGSTATFRPRYA